MNIIKSIVATMLFLISFVVASEDTAQLQRKITRLNNETITIQKKLARLQKQLRHSKKSTKNPNKKTTKSENKHNVHSSALTIHVINNDPASVEFNPTALMADGRVVTYISGMPVVTSPYLGARPAFDGSDYMVNISSINRDIRLMQQRRRLYRLFNKMDYPKPNLPILSLSGKVEPDGTVGEDYVGNTFSDWSLGSGELDVAAAVNEMVEGYIGIAYDDSRPVSGAPRVANSRFFLNLGFVNIGNLDQSPFYFTAGQLYAPFGRYSSSMITPPLPLRLSRTKTRPVILGYKSQEDTGPFAAIYGYKSETTLGASWVSGLNLGEVFSFHSITGEIGASLISSLDDAAGMQVNGTNTSSSDNFAGFASLTNGSEMVSKIPGIDFHLTAAYDRYSLTAEWVSSTRRFREQDLSFNGLGAQPQALQLEAGLTFVSFDRPSSFAVSYQWSKDTLALNMPNQRASCLFNISIWKDTVESLEYRHDVDFSNNQYANGAAPINSVNTNTIGSGGSSDALLAQIGVYF